MFLVMVAALWGSLASDEASPLLPPEARAIEACRSAWKDQPDEVQTISPDPDVVCYRREIQDDSAEIFVDRLSRMPPDRPVYIVLHSGGGEVKSGIDMANAILDRQATTIVDGVCASSCANYVFVAGKKRIVNEASLLLYHGGITETNYERWVAEIAQDVSIENKEEVLASLRQTIDSDIARQQTFLARAGVHPNFFDWMQGVFDDENTCNQLGEDYKMVAFADAVLARQGIKIDVNLSGKSQAEVDAIVTRLKLADRTACYLDSLDWRWPRPARHPFMGLNM